MRIYQKLGDSINTKHHKFTADNDNIKVGFIARNFEQFDEKVLKPIFLKNPSEKLA